MVHGRNLIPPCDGYEPGMHASRCLEERKTKDMQPRVAAAAVGVQECFSMGIVGLVTKAMLAILALEKNDATLAEMALLMQATAKAALAAPPEELVAGEDSSEPFLLRRMISPLLKAGVRYCGGYGASCQTRHLSHSSGAGKDRAPAACQLAGGVLQACTAFRNNPEALRTCSEFLKFILQQQTSSTC